MAEENGASNTSGAVTNTSVLGEMVWLYSNSEIHREWPMGAIQQWLLPPLLTKQFRIYRKGDKPVGFISWARLSKEVEEAYVLNTASLQPKDWQSGERYWLIDWVAPFGGTREIARDLKHNVFPDQLGRYLRMRPGHDTLRIGYVHGANAIAKAQDPMHSPTVELSSEHDAPLF